MTALTAAFPSVPQRLAETYGIRELWLRRFASSSDDLSIDFEGTTGPRLINDILVRCTVGAEGQPPARRFFWDLDVGTRIECLLILASLEEDGEISCLLRCPHPSCGQPIEVELSIREVLEAGREAHAGDIVVQCGSECVTLRRPTGADQLEWLRLEFPDEDTAIRAMIRTLVVEGQAVELTREWITRIEEALDQHDPLVHFSLSVECPYCHEIRPHALNVTDVALRKLKAAQRHLIETVHRLAARYHWSEAEILSIPSWRRARYLSLLEREGTL